MKVSAKCSVKQVLKYAMLGLAVELIYGSKAHHFALLGPAPFAKLWPQHFDSVENLRESIVATGLSSFVLPTQFVQHRERFKQIVNETDLSFFTYERFARFLENAAPTQTDESAEVYRKLLSGLVDEFVRRGPCSSNLTGPSCGLKMRVTAAAP
jgi:hypothetical protein